MSGAANRSRQPRGVATGGQFAASARTEADTTLSTSASDAQQEARRVLDDLTTLDAQGRRWVETEADWHAANEARLHVQTPVPYADLQPNARFVLDDTDGRLEEFRVTGEPREYEVHGAIERSVMVRSQTRGSEHLHLFAPGETAAVVEPPVHLRTDPADVPNEHTLNEAWGV